MSRRATVASIVLVLALLGTGGVFLAQRAESERMAEEARAAVEARQERERRRAERDRERIAEETRALLPPGLEGAVLAMTEEELRGARPGAKPSARARDADKSWLEETLPNGAKVLYGFDATSSRLIEIQVLSVVPAVDASALSRHLQGLGEKLGEPSGMFDCPETGGAPTRQFVWARRHLALRSVILVYGDRLSITLTLGPIPYVEASLTNARCAPLTRENLDQLPSASPEQVARARREAEDPGSRTPTVVVPEPPPAFR